MKKLALIIGLLVAVGWGAGSVARAQGKPAPDPSTMRDADLEKDSLHNLEVARQYFKLKKAYYAALDRSREIVEGNPNFAKIDEALYISGMSSFYLSQNKGKQKVTQLPGQNKRTPEKYREDARTYLSQLINEHPDSSYSKQAQDALRGLGGPLPKNSNQ